MISAVIVLVVILFVLAIIAYYAALGKYKGLEKIPGPPVYPLIGNVLAFSPSIYDNFDDLLRIQRRYGKIVRIWTIDIEPTVIITDPDALEVILSSSKLITKSPVYRHLVPWLGTGLLTSTGTKWHRRRKLLTPAFHFKILENFVPVFEACANVLIEKLSVEVNNDSTDIYQLINLCALDTICETAMGTSTNAQKNSENSYLKAVKEYLWLMFVKEFSVWKRFDFLHAYSSDYRRLGQLLVTLHGFSKSVIKQRREKLNNAVNDSDLGKKRVTFLDLLLKMETEDGQNLTDEDIREEVDTFMFEGHDTISSVASFTLFEIARRQDIQEKIISELRYVFGDNFQEEINYTNVKQLKYMSQVIREGLRLYPSVGLFQREATEDIEIGGYHIPQGTSLVVNAYSLQRSPEHFPDPEKFDPERFTPENCIGRHPFCYLPFSAGPRNCIGQKFAMLEMQTLIAKILMKYKLVPTQPEHKLVIFNDAILKSKTGIKIKVLNR